MTKVDFHKAPYEDNCFYDVVGESFRKDNILAVLRAGRRHVRQYGEWDKLGVKFWLVPEPTNPHDPNAVAVWAGSKRFNKKTAAHVGYIRASDAKRMSPRLKKPFPVEGILVGKRGKYGAKLDIDILTRAKLLG